MARKSSAPAAPAPTTLTLPAPVIANLTEVLPGPDVVWSTMSSRKEIEEWASGWLAAGVLRAASVAPPGPLLLHGPPGTGKTTVTGALARQFAAHGRHVLALDAMRVVSQYMGQTAAQLSQAADDARRAGVVLVLEEIDTIASVRMYKDGPEIESTRTTTALMRVLEFDMPIVATTNRLDVLDPAVERRFEYIVEMPTPDDPTCRLIIANILGLNVWDFALYYDFKLPLTSAVKLARRARRRAVIDSIPVNEAFAQLVKEVTPCP